jgi:hypothetical protein
MDTAPVDLTKWTDELIRTECGRAYRLYERELQQHYTNYFQQNPQLQCPRHPYCARSIAAALPLGYGHLLQRIPRGTLHRFARSARSSQILGLALIGGAAEEDSSFRWFWSALKLPERFANTERTFIQFERVLAPLDLNELPRTTQIDIAIENDRAFVAIETKWSEPGFPRCSCEREGTGSPRIGFDCADRVYARTKYWRTANRFLQLPEARLTFHPCFLSIAYQIVRNIAAARHLSRGRCSGFILLYDQTNPFFRRTGNWPGWPRLLTELLGPFEHSGLCFRAIPWQRLIGQLPITKSVRLWALDKHRLR